MKDMINQIGSVLSNIGLNSLDDARSMLGTLDGRRHMLLELANRSGNCLLDGEPAVLKAPTNGGFWRVETARSGRWAQFTEVQVRRVLGEMGGQFYTADIHQWACC
jgi:hypothetical protein